MKKVTKEKGTWGGRRPGSGQPKKKPTKTISFRVHLELVEPIKKLVKNAIKELTDNN